MQASRSSTDTTGPGRYVLLFIDPTDAGAPAIQARFSAVAWLPGTQPVVVDLCTDPESARWYGITRGPAVAVVCDGILLDVEHDCSEEACARVRESAARRDPRAFEGLLHTRMPPTGATTSTHNGTPTDQGLHGRLPASGSERRR